MHFRPLLLSPTPSLSGKLKRRTNELRSRIIKSNFNTQFAQTVVELAEFRESTAGRINEMDDDSLSEAFQKTIPFTTYEAYGPIIARFFEQTCNEGAVLDLLAPGLPDYLARSTATLGGAPKFFPKYNRFSNINILDVGSSETSDSLPRQRRTTACLTNLCCDPIYLGDENNRLVKTVYVAGVSVVNRRTRLNLHPEEDQEKMATFMFDHVAPYAAQFIRKWRSFLLIHVLFALGNRSLETIIVLFASTFVDMMRHLDAEFDVVMDCIANGTIPDVDGISEVRPYLEMNISPDPQRAAELRSLGRPSSRRGWCSHAWPNLRSITTISSGSFATYTSLVRWFLGPNKDIHPYGYGSTEGGMIALPYSPLELNQYKLCGENIVEFLDISKDDASTLAQVWEVERGKRYEIVLTTYDGLWRYLLGDVVEISGFDPTDGVPIIQFIERRNVAIRFQNCVITEKELSLAILSMASNTPMQIAGWTTMIDHRCAPPTIGFFVELADDKVLDLSLATEHLFDELLRSNQRVASSFERESFRRPTVHLVSHGTFSEFLRLKADESCGGNLEQLKVPPVLSKAAYVVWFSNRVVREL